MKRNSSLVVMVIIWLVTGFLCLLAAGRLAFAGGSNKIPIFVLMSLICFVFAWLRNRQRKKS